VEDYYCKEGSECRTGNLLRKKQSGKIELIDADKCSLRTLNLYNLAVRKLPF